MNEPRVAPRRILIAGINYAPERSGIAPYTTDVAEFFASKGDQVVVLTGMPSYPAWKVFDGYGGRLRHRRQEEGVDVRRFRHFVPARQSAARRASYELSYLGHALTHGPLRRAPDVVIGVVPSLSGGFLAKIEAARYRCPYGLIIQDLMGPAAAESGIPGGSTVSGTTRAIEGWVVRGATGVAVIAESFRGYLERLGVAPERIMHLPNWSHLKPVSRSRDETRTVMGWPANAQIVLHTGNMGLKQGLDNVLEAARLATTELPAARFVFIGDGSQRVALQTRAAGMDNVEFRDLVDEDLYADVLAAADVLVVNERGGLVEMSLPSKLTSYFAVGRPVLAAVPPTSATILEVERAKAGLVVPAEDPPSFVTALRRLLNDQDLARDLGAAGAAYAASELVKAACLARAEAFLERMLPQKQLR
jgi:glycosyltransferase involved in cell wall biosynthesis